MSTLVFVFFSSYIYMLIKNSSAQVCETMELNSFFLQPHSLDNWLAVNNATSPTLAEVLCWVKGYTVTPATRGTYGVHTQKTKRAQQFSMQMPFHATKAL